MKTIDQIKDEIAGEFTYENWDELCHFKARSVEDKHWPEVCKRYAIEVSKAALENAAKNVKVIDNNYPDGYYKSLYGVSVDLYSITDERNIPNI